MGRLYVVATPIGNLKDITFRAIEVLKSVDVIACEDTRITGKLLSYYGISGKKLIPYYEHIEKEASEKIIRLIKEGSDVALVSDAGTPCISDPGYRVVKLAWENNINVVPVPGAFAGAVALSASGLPSDKFLFCGFLPNREKKKKELLEEYIKTGYTFILYESPKRVVSTLGLIHMIAPESEIVVAKELTKIHERFFRGKAEDIIKKLSEEKTLRKGEFVIIVHPVLPEQKPENLEEEIKRLLKEGKKSKEIARELSEKFGVPRNDIYDLILKIKNES
ncbi:16S rRNA (cytidine(1402)-2'-O)-methyltransferase [Persephonella sp.]